WWIASQSPLPRSRPGPKPPARAWARLRRPHAIEPVPEMTTMPSLPPKAPRHANSASVSTSTRARGNMPRRMSSYPTVCAPADAKPPQTAATSPSSSARNAAATPARNSASTWARLRRLRLLPPHTHGPCTDPPIRLATTRVRVPPPSIPIRIATAVHCPLSSRNCQLSGFPGWPNQHFADEALLGLGDQRGDDVGNVVGAQHAAAILAADEIGGKIGVHRAGADHAHANAMAAQFLRHRDRELMESALAGGVGRSVGHGIVSGQRDDIDDVSGTAFDHVRDQGAEGIIDAVEVGLEGRMPRIRRGLMQGRAESANAGIVDEDVHMAEVAQRGLGEGLDRRLRAHIGWACQRPATCSLDFSGQSGQRTRVSGRNYDNCAHTGELERDRPADASAGTGDHGHGSGG